MQFRITTRKVWRFNMSNKIFILLNFCVFMNWLISPLILRHFSNLSVMSLFYIGWEVLVFYLSLWLEFFNFIHVIVILICGNEIPSFFTWVTNIEMRRLQRDRRNGLPDVNSALRLIPCFLLWEVDPRMISKSKMRPLKLHCVFVSFLVRVKLSAVLEVPNRRYAQVCHFIFTN